MRRLALLRWARRHAEAQNCAELTLGVVNGNPAIRLYEREGFEAVPVDACEAACGCFWSTLVLGCPNGRCGGFNMRMRLEGDENERDAKTMSFRGYAKTMSFRTMSMSRGS